MFRRLRGQDSLTLADVAIACSVYPLFNPSDTLLGSDAERAQYGEIVRWVGTLSTSVRSRTEAS